MRWCNSARSTAQSAGVAGAAVGVFKDMARSYRASSNGIALA
jgi:hypothetical protein